MLKIGLATEEEPGKVLSSKTETSPISYLDFLNSMEGKIRYGTWHWAFWWIEESYETLNNLVSKYLKAGQEHYMRLTCQTIALKHLYDQKREEKK